MVDVLRLRMLRAVVAIGSIRGAADALGYTPSAVSQQLTSLQHETGLRLLERRGRGVVPTAAGHALASGSEPLFAAIAHVEGLVEDLRAGRVGTLSIGYFQSVGRTWLAPVVAALTEEFPELRLDLRMAEAAGPHLRVLDIDIFVEADRADHPPEFAVTRLAEDPYVAVVRRDDPLASRGEVPLVDLAGRRWVDNDVPDGPCRRVLLAACAEVGVAPDFAVQAHDYPTALTFVRTGIGITVLPALGVGDLPADLVAVAVTDPTPVRQISVAVRKAIADHPAAGRVVAVLEDVARRRP